MSGDWSSDVCSSDLTTSLICGRGRGGEARDAKGEWEHGGDHGAADSGGEHRRVEERGAGRLGRCLRVLGAAGRRKLSSMYLLRASSCLAKAASCSSLAMIDNTSDMWKIWWLITALTFG